MKTILIETVSNGWIVRPFQPSAEWACAERPTMAVYNRLEDLQADLPKLLEGAPRSLHAALGYAAPLHVIQCGASTPHNNKHSTTGVNPPPLADRDSEGGNTGL